MTYYDEILLEQNFPYRNMEKEDRNFYINLLLHTKDVCDSDIYINKNGLSNYDLLFLNLVKTNGIVRFDGATYNEYESRLISGYIIRKGNKYFIETNVYRCNDVIDDDDKEYSAYDEFIFKDSRIIRKSRYDSSTYSEAEIELLCDDELESYLQGKADELKLKK